VALHVRLEAAQFGAERLAGDGEVSDQVHSGKQGCCQNRAEPAAGERARGLAGGVPIWS